MTRIDIYQDDTWAGEGTIRARSIECTAILGPTGLDHETGAAQDAAERAYEAIEQAIAAGQDSATVDGIRYTWDYPAGVEDPDLAREAALAEIRRRDLALAPGSETILLGDAMADLLDAELPNEIAETLAWWRRAYAAWGRAVWTDREAEVYAAITSGRLEGSC